jgi:hypothetical protein
MSDDCCPNCSPEFINGKPSCNCKCHGCEHDEVKDGMCQNCGKYMENTEP